jgi:hypothetical protein
MQDELFLSVCWINTLYVKEERSAGAARFSFYEAQSVQAASFVIFFVEV